MMHTLGQTGLAVSRLGLGLAALGRPGYINLGHAQDLKGQYDVEAMEANAHTVLDAAWAAGIRYFDAARSYGRAEAFLASWLTARKIESHAVTVGSKWGYTYTADWHVQADKHEVKEHSLATLDRQLAESRKLLGAHLHLYQIHSATLESGVLDNVSVLRRLADLQNEGIKIGLSLSGERQSDILQRALSIHVAGNRLFDCVQATWNLLETSAGPALQQAHDDGMGVIVKEALANGRLTARNTDAGFANKRATLEQTATDIGATIDALALAAVLSQPWADVVLSGAATVEQLASNAAAMKVEWDDRVAQRLETLVETPSIYWQTRSGLAWN